MSEQLGFRSARSESNGESGQAVLEYILLMTVVVSAYLIVARGIARAGVAEKLMRPLSQNFAYTYKYGHPKARGYDEGEPQMHVRIYDGSHRNFRIFINQSR